MRPLRGLGAGGRGPGAGVLRLASLALLGALCAHGATYYLTVSGLGGEPDYEQRFKMWAEDIDGSLKKAGGDVSVVTMEAPTREQIRAKFAELTKQIKPADSLVLILVGHGTYDGHL